MLKKIMPILAVILIIAWAKKLWGEPKKLEPQKNICKIFSKALLQSVAISLKRAVAISSRHKNLHFSEKKVYNLLKWAHSRLLEEAILEPP